MVGVAPPVLSLSELNIILSILGAFILLFGFISIKLKAKWYLGEALPAVVVGICLGPLAANFIDSERWGSASAGQTSEISLGIMRVLIGIQLVIAGFQLPAKYCQHRWKELFTLLIPVMTLMWLCTSACVVLVIPNISFLSALVIGACVTSTDPILSQAIAKGPFADKFVARDLREAISAEAGANDGFGFPFLMLAMYLMRHASDPVKAEGVSADAVGIPGLTDGAPHALVGRAEGVERVGGGVGIALANWIVGTWIYFVFMSVVIGFAFGLAASYALKFALRKKWVDSESYLMYPLALGLWLVGVCGLVGTDDLLACFAAGTALNWNGEFLTETEKLHDEVNSVVDVLLNFGGFMYIGAVLPWDQFSNPEIGITYGRLFALGFLVIVFRRIPAIMATYKFMPNSIKNYKEALFMGYFGPIGVGAVFYVEHTKHLLPKLGEGDAEQTALSRAMVPAVYWLVIFSIVWHGLSIPALNLIYKFAGVKPIQDDAVSLHRKSIQTVAPSNAIVGDDQTFIAFNRFSRPVFNVGDLTVEAARDRYVPPSPSAISRNRRSFAPRDPAIQFDDVTFEKEMDPSNRV
jgi:NhaP-type Na+/H+ or K+/H+ antiporter